MMAHCHNVPACGAIGMVIGNTCTFPTTSKTNQKDENGFVTEDVAEVVAMLST